MAVYMNQGNDPHQKNSLIHATILIDKCSFQHDAVSPEGQWTKKGGGQELNILRALETRYVERDIHEPKAHGLSPLPHARLSRRGSAPACKSRETEDLLIEASRVHNVVPIANGLTRCHGRFCESIGLYIPRQQRGAVVLLLLLLHVQLLAQ